MSETETDVDQRIATVRRFNRFYTGRIGVLREWLLQSPFSLTEARVLYELANREQSTARAIGEELRLDSGYLSRILQGFQKRGLIEKKQSEIDGRQSLLRLTEQGLHAFAQLETGSRNEVRGILKTLPELHQQQLVRAMETIESLLSRPSAPRPSYRLRPPEPGDIGWVVQRHGVLYAREYNWNGEFEGLVSEIAGKFLQQFNPERERCWIAESGGQNVGSVFLVQESATVAKLRLLLVEPEARGMGIGAALVNECLLFARQTGYQKVRLWTDSSLHAARHIYEKAGFRLVEEEAHHSFGHDLVGQTWETDL